MIPAPACSRAATLGRIAVPTATLATRRIRETRFENVVHVTSSTSGVACSSYTNTATVNASNAPPVSAAAASAVACRSQIAPTQTTCTDFKNGTASTLDTIHYTVKSGAIAQNINPGVIFYYVAVTAPSATFDIVVHQSSNQGGAYPLFHVLDDSANQVVLYDSSSCAKSAAGHSVTSVGPPDVVEHITGAIVGQQFILGVKYQTKSLVGAPTPHRRCVHLRLVGSLSKRPADHAVAAPELSVGQCRTNLSLNLRAPAPP